jgi:DNA-binding transcriptional ArsR family regulator
MTAINEGTSEARIAKALAHPLRARILGRLGERVASPGDLAVELGAPLGVVSYHVRMLRDYECIELVRTEPRRGALQHYYRATARPALPEAQWRSLPASLRREMVGSTMTELIGDLTAANDEGLVHDPEIIFERRTLEMDDRAARKMAKLTARYLRDVEKLTEDSRTRHEAPGGHEITRRRTILGVLHFRRALEDGSK